MEKVCFISVCLLWIGSGRRMQSSNGQVERPHSFQTPSAFRTKSDGLTDLLLAYSPQAISNTMQSGRTTPGRQGQSALGGTPRRLSQPQMQKQTKERDDVWRDGSVQAELVELFVDKLELAGPGFFKTEEAIKESIGLPLAALRIAAGLLMIHHGSEGGFWPANFGTPGFDGFVDFVVKPYLGFLPGSPAVWSAIHDYIEYFGGAFLVAGLLTRPASVLLSLTMVFAVYFHLASTGLQGFPFGHVENYSYNFEEPALYGLIFALFAYTGAGPLSADEKIAESLFDQSE
jgi:putative oxidoreductase